MLGYRASVSLLFIFFIALSSHSRTAKTQEYFANKTIRIIVGSSSGGGIDTYARVLSRHFGHYIPGKPNLVVSNMPGASGVRATNYIAEVAPKDGTAIATFNGSMPFYQAMEQLGVRFKAEQLSWIGSMSQSPIVVPVWHQIGVVSIDEAKHKQIILGAATGGGGNAIYPTLLNATLGTQFKLVTGYEGSQQIALAMERGEVGGQGSVPWGSMKAVRPDWIEQKKVIPLVQIGLKKDRDLPDVPLLTELAQTEEQRRLFQFVSGPIAIGRPFAGPPGTMAAPLKTLREAFGTMMTDKAFLAEAEKQNLEIDPQTPEEVLAIVLNVVSTDSVIIEKMRTIMATVPGDGKE